MRSVVSARVAAPQGDPFDRCAALVAALGLGARETIEGVEPLTGGVSADIYRVDLPGRSVCVKFACERLRVADEWFAPTRRIATEYAWLDFVAGFRPGSVPRCIGLDVTLGGFAMEHLSPATHVNWKRAIFAGDRDHDFAAQVGRLAAAVHSRSTREPGLRDRFGDYACFGALRIDPYLVRAAQANSSVADRIFAIAQALTDSRIALVHGDLSPKNILMSPVGPVLLDAECAIFGDPAFDVGFCLTHLLAKTLVLDDPIAVRGLADAFWAGYRAGVDWESADALEQRVAAILPALMLARVDGKSPLEYLDPEAAAVLREVALRLVRDPSTRVDHIVASIGKVRHG